MPGLSVMPAHAVLPGRSVLPAHAVLPGRSVLPARSVFALCLIAACVVLPLTEVHPATYYVATTGSDTNPGTIDQPFLTLAKAVGLSTVVFSPGDTILVRGGVYTLAATVTISRSGLTNARYHLLAYPGERPLLNCSGQATSGTNRGIYHKGNYWYIRGLDIKGAGDNGMIITGSHNIVEHCSFFENRDTGLQLGGGASANQIINCDSYNNADPSQGNADGFAPKLDVGTGNYFFGCRAWQNSDDGWDGYLRGADDVTTTLESCWCFCNGYLWDGSASIGNGNGYKTGGSDTKDLMHNMILKKCIAFDNRVKGFDQNNNRGSITILNGTAYRNGTNYAVADTLAYSRSKALSVINCVALGTYGSLNTRSLQQTNSWLPPFAEVTPADFISIDTTGVRGPRKADGSLPDITYLVPALSSQLVDAGTDVGLSFNGSAPDLGAFETEAPAGLTSRIVADAGGFSLLPTYPNPFNAATTIAYILPGRAEITITIFDLRGTRVRTLLRAVQDAGFHTLRWDATNDASRPVASGTYIAQIQAGKAVRSARLVLLK